MRIYRISYSLPHQVFTALPIALASVTAMRTTTLTPAADTATTASVARLVTIVALRGISATVAFLTTVTFAVPVAARSRRVTADSVSTGAAVTSGGVAIYRRIRPELDPNRLRVAWGI